MSVKIGKEARVDPAIITDTAKLQSVIDGGAKTIFFGEGTFAFDAKILLPHGVSLVGEGPHSTVFDYPSAAALAEMIEVVGPPPGGAIAQGSRIRGIGFTNSGGGATLGVKSSEADTVLEDLSVASLGLDLAGAFNRAIRCDIAGATGIILVSGVWGVVEGCSFIGGNTGISISGDHALVRGNRLDGAATSIIGIHILPATNWAQILGNQLANIGVGTGDGIVCASVAADILVANNVIDGASIPDESIKMDASAVASQNVVHNMMSGGSYSLFGATGVGNTGTRTA